MPGALGDVLDAIQTGLSQLPPVAYVVGLLFGPTAAYIGYRLYTAPKTSSRSATSRPVLDLHGVPLGQRGPGTTAATCARRIGMPSPGPCTSSTTTSCS